MIINLPVIVCVLLGTLMFICGTVILLSVFTTKMSSGQFRKDRRVNLLIWQTFLREYCKFVMIGYGGAFFFFYLAKLMMTGVV